MTLRKIGTTNGFAEKMGASLLLVTTSECLKPPVVAAEAGIAVQQTMFQSGDYQTDMRRENERFNFVPRPVNVRWRADNCYSDA